MWNVFTAHLDVLWGFLVAFAVVVVLTPAVGRVARVLGVVDEPGEARRMHLRAVPRLGGLAIVLGLGMAAGSLLLSRWAEWGGQIGRSEILALAVATATRATSGTRRLVIRPATAADRPARIRASRIGGTHSSAP